MAIQTIYQGTNTMQIPTGDLGYWTGQGWSASQTPQAPQQPSLPQGAPQGSVAISGAQYNTKALQQANFSQITPIGNTLYGVPNVASNLTSSQLTGGTPNVPAATANNQTSPQGTVAGANQYMTQLQADLAAQQAQQQALESRLTAGQTSANDLLAQIGQKGTEYKSELEKYNYTANVSQLQDINRQIASKTAEFQNAITAQEGRVASASSIYGRQALLQRQQASEVGGLSAIAQALQGNITLAQNTAKDAINVKYEPMENQLKQQLQQIEFLYNDLSRADQKKADAQTALLNERLRLVNEQKATETEVNNIALEAAKNGADMNTINTIRNAKDAGEAILAASGATLITNPSLLRGLTENDIIRVGNKIYKKGRNFLANSDKNVEVIGKEYNEETETYEDVYGYYDKASDSFKKVDGTTYTGTPFSGTTSGSIINSPSGNSYDWSTYNAVGTPEQQKAYIQSVQDSINSVGKLNNVSDLENYISTNMSKSNIKAQDIIDVSNETGVGWEEMLGLLKKESISGQSNVAVKNNNFGGITWSQTYQASHPNVSKGTARPASEGGNYVRFATVKDGLLAQAEQFTKRKIEGKVDSSGQGAIDVILGSGKFTKDQKKDIKNSIKSGDDPFTVIKNQAKNIMGQTNATQLQNYETAKQQIQSIQSLLSDYYQKGGSTGIFTGSFEKAVNKLGEVKDPNLVDIATNIAAALQVYRNSVSGTAFSVQEGKEIASIFPGIDKSKGLNDAVIKGRLNAFDTTIDASYRNVLGNVYDQLKGTQTQTNSQVETPEAIYLKGLLNSNSVNKTNNSLISTTSNSTQTVASGYENTKDNGGVWNWFKGLFTAK